MHDYLKYSNCKDHYSKYSISRETKDQSKIKISNHAIYAEIHIVLKQAYFLAFFATGFLGDRAFFGDVLATLAGEGSSFTGDRVFFDVLATLAGEGSSFTGDSFSFTVFGGRPRLPPSDDCPGSLKLPLAPFVLVLVRTSSFFELILARVLRTIMFTFEPTS